MWATDIAMFRSPHSFSEDHTSMKQIKNLTSKNKSLIDNY